ncbi:MAG: hypothetical protein R2940_02005 [Syntrophotaleaceae bacterium]
MQGNGAEVYQAALKKGAVLDQLNDDVATGMPANFPQIELGGELRKEEDKTLQGYFRSFRFDDERFLSIGNEQM